MAYVTVSTGKRKKTSHSIKDNMKGIGQIMHRMKTDAFRGYGRKKKR